MWSILHIILLLFTVFVLSYAGLFDYSTTWLAIKHSVPFEIFVGVESEEVGGDRHEQVVPRIT